MPIVFYAGALFLPFLLAWWTRSKPALIFAPLVAGTTYLLAISPMPGAWRLRIVAATLVLRTVIRRGIAA